MDNEIDYKKQYRTLVGKIKNAYLYAQTDSTKNVLVDILPELRDSEDKRIKKCIYSIVHWIADNSFFFLDNGVTKDDVLAYLEKKKLEKPVEWNESDEKTYKKILSILDYYLSKEKREGETGEEINECISWIKNRFNELPRHKITEKHIEALQDAINCLDGEWNEHSEELDSLINILRNL